MLTWNSSVRLSDRAIVEVRNNPIIKGYSFFTLRGYALIDGGVASLKLSPSCWST